MQFCTALKELSIICQQVTDRNPFSSGHTALPGCSLWLSLYRKHYSHVRMRSEKADDFSEFVRMKQCPHPFYPGNEFLFLFPMTRCVPYHDNAIDSGIVSNNSYRPIIFPFNIYLYFLLFVLALKNKLHVSLKAFITEKAK